MKFPIIPAVVAWLVSGALTAQAQIFFSDNFTVSAQSDDVNFEYNSGRQSGALGSLQYRQGNGNLGTTISGTIANEANNGYKTQIGNTNAPGTLYLAGGNPAFSLGSVSPEHNFIENPGVGNYLSISFTLDPVIGASGTSTDWGAITFGADDNASFGASGTGARGQSILSTAANFGILFRDNGQYQAFDAGTQVSSGTYSATPTTTLSHTIELRITGLVDGNPWDGANDAQIDVFADGGSAPVFSFTKTGGYTSNYVTLEAFGSSGGFSISTFDNVQIAVAAVPEPSTACVLGIGVALALVARRRRMPC
jgi:hypothetical protein